MPRSARAWLCVAGGWLVLGGLAHLAFHVWGIVLENDTAGGLREFAMNAMKQAQSPDPLRPTMWRLYRLFSVSLGLAFLLGGVMDLVMAATGAPRRVLATVAVTQTVFWTLAFIPFALLDPVIQPLSVVAIAVPLHGIAYVMAAETEPDPDPA